MSLRPRWAILKNLGSNESKKQTEDRTSVAESLTNSYEAPDSTPRNIKRKEEGGKEGNGERGQEEKGGEDEG